MGALHHQIVDVLQEAYGRGAHRDYDASVADQIITVTREDIKPTLRAFERAFIFICENHPLGPTNDRTKAGKLIDELRVPLASLRDMVEPDEQEVE